MNVGYASAVLGLAHCNFKTIRQSSITNDRLIEVIRHNLTTLEKMIDYNIANKIKLFRISSDLIPFGSSPLNEIPWEGEFNEEFQTIAHKIKTHNIRVSMHPGQYSVLNSPDEQIVKRTVDDLIYHAKVLEALQTPFSSKIVLHIGGVYGDKEKARARFINNFKQLPEHVKKRLVIENDEKSYNILDVLTISEEIGAPVIFDNLHHELNKPEQVKTDAEWIELCKLTFKVEDGRQKIHYSQQDPAKQPGAHAKTINARHFLTWFRALNRDDIDIMLEVKDKNLSALKIKNCTDNQPKISTLEKAWAKYKYMILEHSPFHYQLIRTFLKEKHNIDPLSFYDLIDEALCTPVKLGTQINAIEHVCGYFKTNFDDQEIYKKKISNLKKGTLSVLAIKKWLYSKAQLYNYIYLLESYFLTIS